MSPRCAAELLPLWELEDGLIVTTQGAYLRAYEVHGLDSEHLSSDVLTDAATHLYASAKSELPDETYLQLVLEGHGDYSDVFEAFAQAPASADPVLQLQRRRRLEYLQGANLRRHRLLAAVGPLKGLTRREFQSLDETEHKKRTAAVDATGRALVGMLGRAGMSVSALSEAALEQHYCQALTPVTGYAPTRRCDLAVGHDDQVRLRSRREQIVDDVQWTPKQVRLQGRPHKVLFLEGLPDETGFTLTEALLHLGVDFRFSLHLHIARQDAMAQALKHLQRITHADAHRNPNVADAERVGRVQEANALGTVLAETKQKLVKVGAQLVLWGDDEGLLAARVRAATEHLKGYGLVFREETGRHDRELPKSLLGMGAGFDRLKLVTSNNAVDLMPLFGASHGDRRPVFMTQTARGELYSFDPVEPARDNHNAVVFGASGAGKSVFLNMLIATAMLGGQTGGRVFVVDFAGETKSSYLMVAKLFGGVFVPVVSKDAAVALNPFPPAEVALDEAGQLTSETLNFLLVLTDLLLTNTGTDRDAQLYRTLLQRALQDVYADRADDEAPTYRDLAAVLEGYRGTADVDRDRLAVLLELLQGFLASPDSRFFLGEGRAPIADSPFVIFDLFGIDSLAPQTAEALVFLTTQHVKRVAFGSEGQSYVVLDEVAQLLKRPEMVSLVDELYSTARKHATSVWTVTQNYGSYCKSAVAETVKLNSTTQVFLSHATAADVRAKVAEDFDFSARELYLLESLVTRKGEYSEVLLRTQVFDKAQGGKVDTTAKLRIQLSPFDYELATSDAADRVRQQRWIQQNPGLTLARILDGLGKARRSKGGA